MTDTDTLVARMRAAVDRISAAADALPNPKDAAKLEGQIHDLTAQNKALRAELDQLKIQRQEDVRELDTLLAELKPLIQEPS